MQNFNWNTIFHKPDKTTHGNYKQNFQIGSIIKFTTTVTGFTVVSIPLVLLLPSLLLGEQSLCLLRGERSTMMAKSLLSNHDMIQCENTPNRKLLVRYVLLLYSNPLIKNSKFCLMELSHHELKFLAQHSLAS